MKTRYILLLFIVMWMLSVPVWGQTLPDIERAMTGVVYQNGKVLLVIQDEVMWSVLVDQKCMEKELTQHYLYMALYCAEWDKLTRK